MLSRGWYRAAFLNAKAAFVFLAAEWTYGKSTLDDRSTAADKLQNEHHQRDQKQNMDICSQYMEAYEAQQPQHQQYYEDCPEHLYLSPRKYARFGMVWCA
jgi:hypothetical protein